MGVGFGVFSVHAATEVGVEHSEPLVVSSPESYDVGVAFFVQGHQSRHGQRLSIAAHHHELCLFVWELLLDLCNEVGVVLPGNSRPATVGCIHM